MATDALRVGDPVVGAACPKCGRESVVYNGNYWCERESCDWRMSGERPERRKSDRDIIKRYLVQRWRAAREAGDGETVDRMASYLSQYAGPDGWL